MTSQVRLDALIRYRDAALRKLERADRCDKGSQWITHPEKMRRLAQDVRDRDAEVEAYAARLGES